MSHPTLDLKRAYLALRRALDVTVKPFGLTASQFDVLQLLLHDDGLEHNELQRRLAITSPTLTNILDVLQRQDHITRQPDPSDARVKKIFITPAARAICLSPEFCAAGDTLVDRMFQGFSHKQRTLLLSQLSRIEKNLDSAQ